MNIYFNDEDNETLKQLVKDSGARSVSAYIKSVIFGSEMPVKASVRHVKVTDPDLIRHLAWVGHSLNQISRAVNLSDEVSEVTAIGLYSTLAVMAEALEKVQEDNSP